MTEPVTLRLGLMIRHIAEHNSFDKQDLVSLLKTLQQERNEHNAFIFKATQDIESLSNAVQNLKESIYARKQA